MVWVDGEPVADVDVLLDQVLRGLGAERLPGQSPADAVRSAVEGSAVLVVLDGVEHLATTWSRAPTGGRTRPRDRGGS